MPTRNLRHGRIRVMSGDTPVRLEKTCAFTEGDFTFAKPRNVIQVKDRGALSHLRRGDEEAVTFSFAAKFVDRTLRDTLEHGVFEGQAYAAVGLTPQVVNAITVPYAYLSDSLEHASGEAINTKLANGVTPSGDGEYAELAGALRGGAEQDEVTSGQFKAQPGVADTDMDVVYDAVGGSTLDGPDVVSSVADPRAESDVRTFLLLLEKMDPARNWIVDEVYELNHASVENVEQAEGDEYDTVSFTGIAYVRKVSVNELTEGPGEEVIDVELADSIFVGDEISIQII